MRARRRTYGYSLKLGSLIRHGIFQILAITFLAVAMIEFCLMASLVTASCFSANACVAMLAARRGAVAMTAVATLAHGKEAGAPLTGKNVSFDLIQSELV